MNDIMTAKIITFSIGLWLILSGCGQAPLTPTPVLCNGYALKTEALPNCMATNSGTLIQTGLNQQSQIFIDTLELTIQGTTYIQPSDNTLMIAVLEGTTLIGKQNSITTLYENQEITINEDMSLSEPTAYDSDAIVALPINELARSVDIILPTPTIELIPTDAPECPRPADWIDEYTVKSGDTLTTIAQAIGESLTDLQTANCIDNPNSLRVGQILIVPQGAMPTPQLAQTFTPSAVFFRTDNESITRGDCTMLRWDIQNIRTLMLDSVDVTGQTGAEICPTVTSTYTLTVSYFDDTQSEHFVTVTVNQA